MKAEMGRGGRKEVMEVGMKSCRWGGGGGGGEVETEVGMKRGRKVEMEVGMKRCRWGGGGGGRESREMKA